MKKIIYRDEHEVNLGDIIVSSGVRITITDELIELNPELFDVIETPMFLKCVESGVGFTSGKIYKHADTSNYPDELGLMCDSGEIMFITKLETYFFEPSTKEEYDNQELLEKAKRDYPVGTKYRHLNSEHTPNSPDSLTVTVDDYFIHNTIVWVGSGSCNGALYSKGEWAEIVTPKFTTEDGVDIYYDMRTYKVLSKDTTVGRSRPYDGIDPMFKYFYYKKNALAYLEKCKEKTLEDYEDMLFEEESGKLMAMKSSMIYFTIWGWAKDNEPKIFYNKILQVIADDLNDGWKADYINRSQEKWVMTSYKNIDSSNLNFQGAVVFKSEELAHKARTILGDKIKYIFKG